MAFRLISSSRRGLLGIQRAAMFSTDVMKLEMPALSPTMETGTIVKWNIPEGGKVDIGDVICEI